MTQKNLGQLLKESRDRLRLAIGAAGIGIFEIDVGTQQVRYSRELAAMLGIPGVRRTELKGAFARIHRDDLARVLELYQAALAPSGSGRLLMQFRFVKPGGEVRWMTWNGKVEFVESGEGKVAHRIVGACSDITEARRAEDAARDREIFLTSIIDSLPQHVCVLEPSGIIKAVNRPWLRFAEENDAMMDRIGIGVDYLGICRQASSGGDASGAAAYEGLQRLLARECDSFSIEYPCHSPTTRRWFMLFASRSVSEADIIVSHFDVTQRRLAEENVRYLMREISHRGKNMLSLVQAIARQTASVGDEGFLAKFSSRIDALAASQDQLVREGWESVDLRDLLRAQLAHFGAIVGHRVSATGPPVKLTAEAAQTIGMALHELATNAAKYGALSNATGEIEIAWAISEGSLGAQLELEWTERGGPEVVRGSRQGFGTTLIEQVPRMAFNARVSLDYPATGCQWRLVCDLARVSRR